MTCPDPNPCPTTSPCLTDVARNQTGSQGPRGVYLRDFGKLEARNGVAPAGWSFSKDNWWVEEHGLLMETPDFPLPPGRYLVTGDREVTTPLTVKPDGSWKLEQGSLYDVTHLPCRAAKYSGGSPADADPRDFPVRPGAAMPAVRGADKQDYAVRFVIGVERTYDPRYG